ncbi:MFS transporter, DHA1 family, bicyclomycin/chloramphenicol resistance protein [Noviherbaspirillum humi]|uniref:Bcr/CflA family efflux transporter n=1 Tax=Noviherbaspirillum humi TaxID=1688639 RepID=A0A239KD80_9BURK|nr:multidrug effflux MFS transporter [Noviherbaspirillum humi]SNT15064.1 MFS transporter, DHA1 family, bicyclomycin/chloramphenicol resistance protein [Noviherbaspirillum humi]
MPTHTSTAQPLPAFAHAPLILLVTAFMALQPLSTDLYLASLPSLASGFGVPLSTVQLTLSLFVIGFGGAQLIVGPLSDRFGRRPVLLAGLSLYLAASILCALAPSMAMLIFARFLQALGCCAGVIIARAVVRDAYAPQDGARVMARCSTWLSLAPLLGPILGSYLQVTFGWRAAFVAHTLISAVVLLLTIQRLPETNTVKNPHATDPRGLLASYRLILGSREFWLHALPGAFSYGAIFCFISGSSIVLIRVLTVPTAWFGFCFAFGVSGYLIGTLLCRRLLPRMGTQSAFRLGTLLSMGAGLLFLASVAAGVAHWSQVLVVMFLIMSAHGINFPIAQSGAVTPFPQQAGTAAGLMGALNMLVALLVGTVVGATHNGTLYPLAIIACVLGMLVYASLQVATRAPEVAHG